MKRSAVRALALSVVLLLPSAFTTAQSQGGLAPDATWTIIGWNNLGMHCMDADFAVWSILPPYNTIHAQLIDPTGALVLDPAARGITVTYQAVVDPSGSINQTSAGKTNFWKYLKPLFGVELPVDMGLAGKAMPGPANTPRTMTFDAAAGWFIAEGIPITPVDDARAKNAYPLMHLVARNSSGTVLASTNIVLPVSDEMDCRACHSSGSAPAARPAAGWSWDADSQRDYRLNVLLLHDDRQRTNPVYVSALATAGFAPAGLYATATAFGTPILCAKCHASEALPGSGLPGIPPLTSSVHSLHATAIDPTNSQTLDSSANRSACYRCHPGSTTKCLRGAMGSAVAGDGSMAMQCQACHGSMSQVGSPLRTGWFDEPTCQNCHTGTATSNNGQIRYTSVYDTPGHRRVAVNGTFATNNNAPLPGLTLYRFSFGHGALACESCHGSTHAEFPSAHQNDNLQSLNLQGHAGVLADCETCHGTAPVTSAGGPHGMHPIGQWWITEHHDYIPSLAACQGCHGSNNRGTVLSRSQADRVFSTRFGTKTFWNGFQIGCYTCHNGPSSSTANPNRPPVATSTAASTTAGTSVSVPLTATDADNNPLTLRIIGQPARGTVALAGTVAVYFPEAGFVGADAFTFAANDGATDSNLATVSLTVNASPCSLTCSAAVPASAPVGSFAAFSGSATASGCGASPGYEWDFGDGSVHSTVQSPVHQYAASDTYQWTMTVRAGTGSCVRSGTLRTLTTPLRVPYFLQPIRVTTASFGRDLTITWDRSNCPSSGYHLIYGYGSGLRTWTVAGGVCAVGTTGTVSWNATPDPRTDPSRLLWFLVAGDNGAAVEGSWGTTSAGAERGGASASRVCGISVKDTSGYCAAP